MVRKLLILLFVLFIFVFSVSQSQAQTSQDISCSPTTPCPTQINCSVGCLSVSLTCVNGLCRVPSGLLCSNTLGMSNGGCTENNYCTRNPSVGNYTCQTSKPNGSSCTDMSECQPNTAFGGDRVCAVNLCGASPRGVSCCPSGKFWCASTNSCTNQGDGSCPCEVTTTPIPPTPTSTEGGTANGPTPTSTATADSPKPTSTTCRSNGILSTSYNKSSCFSDREAKSITVTCNDGTQKTFTSSFQCTDTFRLDFEAQNFCSTHKTCPPSAPSITPTSTPQQLSCDPVKDGYINRLDYELWLKEYTHQVNTTLTSCFVPGDNTVNILDFQVWKDINYGLRTANSPVSQTPPIDTRETTPIPSPTHVPPPTSPPIPNPDRQQTDKVDNN